MERKDGEMILFEQPDDSQFANSMSVFVCESPRSNQKKAGL
jgi:hypothetical protein